MHDGQFSTIAKFARKYLAMTDSSAPSERVMEPSPSTFGGVCHAEAQCMVNYKYLDSKRAVCIAACYVSQTQFLYL